MRVDVTQKKTLLAVAALVAIFGGALWYPAVRDISSLRQQIAASQQELMGTHGRTTGLGALAREVQRIEAELKTTRRTIPREGELAELLRELSTQVAEMQLADPSVATRPQVDGGSYVTMPVEVSFRGDSRSAFGFVNRVEAMERLVQLTGLRMQADREPGRIDAQVELNAFFYANAQGEQTP